jgi:hypothetical protein
MLFLNVDLVFYELCSIKVNLVLLLSGSLIPFLLRSRSFPKFGGNLGYFEVDLESLDFYYFLWDIFVNLRKVGEYLAKLPRCQSLDGFY